MTKFIIPRAGVNVLNPATNKPLKAEGEEVTFSVYWYRRQTDGDISVSRKPRKSNKKGE